MLTAILVDDEYYALEGLKTDLEELGGIKVIGMYEEGKSALENISKLRPDIVFLDIDMPEMNGLELFEEILEESPRTHIVFVTAYNEYAVEAFELNAADYIVKPVRKERLKKAIYRLQKKCNQYNQPVEPKSISIECFGHLSIKIDGNEKEISWRTKKVEELVAYLACEEGKFIAKEKIAEILWPELDIKRSKSNFYLAYHYLKKQAQQFGDSIPLESGRGKIRLKVEEVELDIILFKEETTALKKIAGDNIERAEKAIQLYKGMLLEDHYYEWSMEYKQYYDILYRDLLKKIIEYYKVQKNTEKQKYYLKKLNN